MPKNVMCKNCNNLINNLCEKKIDGPYPDMIRDCQYFWQRTNADRIRAMSDEELAKVLNAFTAYFDECNRSVEVSCKDCEMYKLCALFEGQAMEWLKQPTKGE